MRKRRKEEAENDATVVEDADDEAERSNSDTDEVTFVEKKRVVAGRARRAVKAPRRKRRKEEAAEKVEVAELSEYERIRAGNIAEREAMLATLGILDDVRELKGGGGGGGGGRKARQEQEVERRRSTRIGDRVEKEGGGRRDRSRRWRGGGAPGSEIGW